MRVGIMTSTYKFNIKHRKCLMLIKTIKEKYREREIGSDGVWESHDCKNAILFRAVG